MQKKSLFTGKKSHLLYSLLLCFCFTTGWSQTELVLNGTADEHTSSTSDNADAWDMTPNSTIKDEADMEIESPYKALWNNSALGSYLEDTYNGGSGVDEQPGSTSSGFDGTRGVKLYGDGDPAVTESTRRLYQKIKVDAGAEYTFTIQSRSEAENIPSEVFILNEDITTEVGLENGAADSRVDAYLEITNDFDAWTTSTFDFVATTDSVVIYVRALLANTGETEVFYDNISLVQKTPSSANALLASKFSVFPNPANNVLQISSDLEINKVEMYDILGREVITSLNNYNNLDISSLSKGVYVLKITSGASIISKKIVKE